MGKDHVITVGDGLSIQLPPLPSQRGFSGRKVEVCQQPDGRLLVYLERRLLLEQAAIPDRPVKALKRRRSTAPKKKTPVRLYQLGGRHATGL